jgi:hypothetical protein
MDNVQNCDSFMFVPIAHERNAFPSWLWFSFVSDYDCCINRLTLQLLLF